MEPLHSRGQQRDDSAIPVESTDAFCRQSPDSSAAVLQWIVTIHMQRSTTSARRAVVGIIRQFDALSTPKVPTRNAITSKAMELCMYASKRCWNLRCIKANGELHRFCLLVPSPGDFAAMQSVVTEDLQLMQSLTDEEISILLESIVT